MVELWLIVLGGPFWVRPRHSCSKHSVISTNDLLHLRHGQRPPKQNTRKICQLGTCNAEKCITLRAGKSWLRPCKIWTDPSLVAWCRGISLKCRGTIRCWIIKIDTGARPKADRNWGTFVPSPDYGFPIPVVITPSGWSLNMNINVVFITVR